MEKTYLTVEEASKKYNRAQVTILSHTANGNIESKLIDGRRMIEAVSAENYFQNKNPFGRTHSRKEAFRTKRKYTKKKVVAMNLVEPLGDAVEPKAGGQQVMVAFIPKQQFDEFLRAYK